MGKSDSILFPYYKSIISPVGKTALLGFSDNRLFGGDLYDKNLGNWNINDDWSLPQKYDTIISLRCPYFAKHPRVFFNKCVENLNSGGRFYLEWGLGDHWRFKDYKIGWVKNEEQEFAYEDSNLLWSAAWNDVILKDPETQSFIDNVQKFGYTRDLKKHVYEEVPSIFHVDNSLIERYNIKIWCMFLWPESPQLYILLSGTKYE